VFCCFDAVNPARMPFISISDDARSIHDFFQIKNACNEAVVVRMMKTGNRTCLLSPLFQIAVNKDELSFEYVVDTDSSATNGRQFDVDVACADLVLIFLRVLRNICVLALDTDDVAVVSKRIH
jgi:hypothetical protein